jgi:RNA polymerase sigma-70 factor, ECF subfamily
VGHLGSIAEPLLLALAASEDRAAFAELVRRRQPGVRRFMRQLCRDATLADDLAQQVFLRLWRRRTLLTGVASFGGYLRQVMVSVWVDETRSREPLHESLQGETISAASMAPHPAGLAQDLEWALAQLEPRTRLCVVLAHSEGRSHAEIATLLDLPLGTVKSTVTRGSATLRTLLGAYRDEGVAPAGNTKGECLGR